MRLPDTSPAIASANALDRTTPVPNALLDTFLPHLSDTELRVLLVVDRSTLGWKDGTGRKRSDWLSHRQLQTRTGRAGASVSRAIESLVRRGLLVVEDGAGQARSSAHSRRATRGRLYYRLSDTLLDPSVGHSLSAGREQTQSSTMNDVESEVWAQEERIRELKNASFPEANAGNEASLTSPVRLQKVKTTKETDIKEKEEMSSLKNEVNPPQDAVKENEMGVEEDQKEEADDLDEQIEHFVKVFTVAYRLAHPNGSVPPIEAADKALLRRYLRHPGFAVLEAWLPAFFASSFGYARRRAWSLHSYLDCLFILQAQIGS